MYPDKFNEWWSEYPRRVGKRVALKQWKTAISEIADDNGVSLKEARQWLLDRTMEFARSEKGNSGQFCPHPATWLNQGRYDDDQEMWNNDEKNEEDNKIPTDEDLSNWRP